MSVDDLKGLWQSQAASGAGASDADILETVVQSAAELDRAVRRRDRIEIGVAVVVSALFIPLLWNPSWVVRAGVLLYLGGSLLTYLKLREARGARTRSDPAAPVVETIRDELVRVEGQIRLLESVLWWYIAPLGLAVVLIFAGLRGPTWMTAAYTAAVAVFCAFVYRWNRAAVERDLRPRRDHLRRLLEQAET